LRRATLIAVLSKQGRRQPEKLKSTRIQIESPANRSCNMARQQSQQTVWHGFADFIN